MGQEGYEWIEEMTQGTYGYLTSPFFHLPCGLK